jgi:hypothetical protein
MNKSKLYSTVLLLILALGLNGQTYFYEDFEDGGNLPSDWTQEFIHESYLWRASPGGYTLNPGIPGSRRPPEAYEGTYNAMFEKYTNTNAITRFVTPEISLDIAIKAQLRFYHTQYERTQLSGGAYNDILRVYGKYIDELENETWVLLNEYTQEVPSWTLREINIPDSMNNENFKVAFEGQTGPGWGVCIDSVAIIETGVIGRFVKSVDIQQGSQAYVPAGEVNNTILRVDIKVKGNQGTIMLDSLLVQNLSNENLVFPMNGVKLYETPDTVFRDPVLIGTSANFVANEHSFTSLNYELQTGNTSIWVTYDAPLTLPHELHGAIMDAQIPAGGVNVSGGSYPSVDQSPSGYRVIYESLFVDDFEAENGWIFQNEFQWGEPLGEGGEVYGIPDPEYAYSGDKVIGTDLAGLGSTHGDYENSLNKDAYEATSPSISSAFFAEMSLQFYRWLNVENFDTARIYYSNNNGSTWNQLWKNNGTIKDSEWSDFSVELPADVNYSDQMIFKFALGGTDAFVTYSGWNVDNISLVGDYIYYDPAVIDYVEPYCNCEHSSEEYIVVKVTNNGALSISDVPIGYSLDGGDTWVMESISSVIASQDTVTYTFSTPADFSNGGWYNILVSTFYSADELDDNNMLERDQFMPYQLTIPYTNDFEVADEEWTTDENSDWELGEPVDAVIFDLNNSAWITDLYNDYQNADSSLLIGPCLDFSATSLTIFEFKMWSQFADANDGLTLMYYTEDIDAWQPVPGVSYYNWTWYDEENPVPPTTTGWNSSTAGWTTMRTLLPASFSDFDYVRLGFLFTSNGEGVDEGVAIDDIKVYDAPHDFAMESFDYPIDSCELSDTTHVKVTVKNAGPSDALAGIKIPIELKWIYDQIITDTIVLSETLAPDGTVKFTFNQTIAMDSAGDYPFSLITKYDSINTFYGASNDTLLDAVSVTGMPRYNPLPDYTGKNGLFVELDAGSGFEDYYWSNTEETQKINAFVIGSYYVTVTNDEDCEATDSTWVVESVDDISMESLQAIPSACEYPNPVDVEIQISNLGEQVIASGQVIPVAYKLNNNSPVRDTILLESDFNVSDVLSHTFSTPLDLSTSRDYRIAVYADFQGDLDRSNDTLYLEMSTWGNPQDIFNQDTIYSANVDTLILSAGEGYSSYLWQDGETITPDFDVVSGLAQMYYVTIVDENGCGPVADSIYVNTHDIEIINLTSPVTACSHSNTEVFVLELINQSENIIPANDSILFNIRVADNDWEHEKYTIPENIEANEAFTVVLTSTFDLTESEEYEIVINTDYSNDADPVNDTLVTSINTLGYPSVDLAFDTVLTRRPDTLVLHADEGYTSYLWSNGSTNASISNLTSFSNIYSVTVSNDDGCGWDADTAWVFTYDLQLIEIYNPVSGCALTQNEKVKLKVNNNSNDTLFPGMQIPVNTKMNNQEWTEELVTLTDTITKNERFFLQLNQDFDMSDQGQYTLQANINYPFDASPNNDTVVETIEVYGYPEFEINYDTIFSTQLDTIDLIVTPPGYVSYYWNTGVNNDTLSLGAFNRLYYSVTVSDVYGCASSDSVLVQGRNFEIGRVVAPISSCELSADEQVTVRLYNTGLDTVFAGESVAISIVQPIQVNNTLIFDRDIVPGDSIDFTFDTPLDFSDQQSKTITVDFDPLFDVKPSDNEHAQTVEVYGYPEFSVNYDVINTLQPDTIDLVVLPSTYISYEWNVGVDNDTLSLSNYDESVYAVTVTDYNGCSSVDSIWVNQKNLELATLLSPENACANAENELISVELINSGYETIPAGSSISLSVLNPETVTDVIEVDADLEVGASILHTFTEDFDFSATGTHAISIVLEADFDVHEADNELSTSIETYGYPEFEINYDTVHSLQPDTTTLIVTPGTYASYLWSVDVDNDTLPLAMFDETSYIVTVSDLSGCSAIDSVKINQSNLELGVLLKPVNACSHGTSENIQLRLYNSGNDTLRSGTEIEINISDPLVIVETRSLAVDLIPGDSVDYTLSESVDLSTIGEYTFDITINTALDVLAADNHLTQTVETYGPAEVDLGDEITISELPYELSPAGDYTSYLWHDESTEATFEINANTLTSTGLYMVTVTNQNGCTGSDSRRVHVNIVDWAAEQVLAPGDACVDEFSSEVRAQISSQSPVPVALGRTFDIAYRLNGGDLVTESFTLSDSVYPQGNVDYTFDTQVEPELGVGNVLELIVNNADDFNDANNSLASGFTIYNPEIEFGQDTLRPESFPYTLTAPGGFSSYEWGNGEFGQSILIEVQGWYSVVVTDDFACAAEDSVFVVDPISILDIAPAEALNVYPNPAKTEVFIELTAALAGRVQIEFVGASGATLIDKVVDVEPNTPISIDTQHLPEGVYLIKVSGRGSYAIRTLLINR